MRKIHHLFCLLTIMLWGTHTLNAENSTQKPRIGIVGIAIECSTFSPAKTHESAFRVKKEESVFDLYPFLAPGTELRNKATWLPAMVSRATPGGIVTKEAYESLVKQSLQLVKQNMPYDAIYLDIHGAMSVVGLDDPEGDFIVRLREIVGGKTVISASMDPHGCVSHRLAQNTDLITCYRMAPHEDSQISRQRAVENLVERIETGKGKPKYKAWVYVPILLPGEKTSTRIDPGKSLYAKVAPAVDQEGVVDGGIWISYAWADEPRNHGTVMIVGDDKRKVEKAAADLARSFWNVRDKFEFVAPTSTLDKCLAAAFASDKKPYYISDMGDNPTAGGAGDVTWTLHELFKREELKKADGPNFIYASIPGPELVEAAIKAGKGNHVSGFAGAKEDSRYAGPVEISGIVEAIHITDKNKEVAIRVGSMHVIVTEKRKGYHYERDFVNLGLNPRTADIVMVKLGYLTEELYDIQADWMMALTKGGVDQDLLNLPYQRIHRPMYPLDPDMKTPKFKVEFIPQSK